MSESAVWWAYFAGFLTPFVIALGSIFGVRLWLAAVSWLKDSHGITFDFADRGNRDRWDYRGANQYGYRDYDLRHGIIWMTHRGPVFWGHWLREEGYRPVVTRWVGFGNYTGKCLTVYRKRALR